MARRLEVNVARSPQMFRSCSEGTTRCVDPISGATVADAYGACPQTLAWPEPRPPLVAYVLGAYVAIARPFGAEVGKGTPAPGLVKPARHQDGCGRRAPRISVGSSSMKSHYWYHCVSRVLYLDVGTR